MIRILVLAAGDFWAESFLLMVFNLICSLSSLPGFALIGYGAASRDLMVLALGIVALGLWPLATFGLFHAATLAAMRRPVHLRTMLDGARSSARLAYRWGVTTFAMAALLATNVAYYLDPQAPPAGTTMASFLAGVFLLLLLLWLVGCTFLAGWIATGQADSLHAAWRCLAMQCLAHPAQTLLLGLVALLLLALGVIVIPAGLLLAFALVASLACRAVLTWGGTAAPPSVVRT